MRKGSRILITGAAGFTGRHACSYFASLGCHVTGIVRQLPSRSLDGSESLRLRVCDLTKQDDVQQLIAEEQPHYVLHLAGLNAVADSWVEPLAYMQVNVLSTLHLLEGVRRSGLTGSRVLVAGSMLSSRLTDDERRPAPDHPYGLSKSLQSMLSLAWSSMFGLSVLIAKPSNLIGPGESNGLCGLIGAYAAQVEAGEPVEPFYLSSTTAYRDFLDVRDAVRAYALLLEHGECGRTYPIGSGLRRSLGEAARCFEQEATVPLWWRVGAADATPVRLTCAGDDTTLNVPKPAPSEIDPLPMQQLGWTPSIAFKQSVADIIAYHRHQRLD
ncbi:NAD(P)-dependent oxidoreductase [Paenibacillus sp. YYML68]|uniref:NAD-dependent epimerase/dehydratase family protein n=1 Tax=Paenibacillus sp. YYML68 TaxID=2909250 RepID=UPI002491F2E5|nr:NAD-dependent epimerase/dehydratase family protein [Paenibacillus sp. YYML68]